MNNLKFRAWDKANKKMLKIDIIDFYSEEIMVLEDDSTMKFSDVVLMQSTGLFDKNGVEFEAGQKIAQIVFSKKTDVELEQTNNIENNTDRGIGGFGSTGAF